MPSTDKPGPPAAFDITERHPTIRVFSHGTHHVMMVDLKSQIMWWREEPLTVIWHKLSSAVKDTKFKATS